MTNEITETLAGHINGRARSTNTALWVTDDGRLKVVRPKSWSCVRHTIIALDMACRFSATENASDRFRSLISIANHAHTWMITVSGDPSDSKSIAWRSSCCGPCTKCEVGGTSVDSITIKSKS